MPGRILQSVQTQAYLPAFQDAIEEETQNNECGKNGFQRIHGDRNR